MNMKKSDFMFMYPDVAVQKIEFKTVLSKKEIETSLLELTKMLGTGLLAYEVSGKWVEAFTSVNFLKFKERMIKDAILRDLNGTVHKVVSDMPFMCGGVFCIRTECEGNEDVYACTCFDPYK